MAAVLFDYSAWAARYPELEYSVLQPQAQAFFDEAGLYCDNTPGSPIRNEAQRLMLLGMVTAHIAALNAPIDGQPSSTLVGRISNASEGSVSVQVAYSDNDKEAWYAQTKYGAAYWRATSQFRGMRYYAPQRKF